jgi:hypothetical protein
MWKTNAKQEFIAFLMGLAYGILAGFIFGAMFMEVYLYLK